MEGTETIKEAFGRLSMGEKLCLASYSRAILTTTTTRMTANPERSVSIYVVGPSVRFSLAG
jgi:hypothetical protein